MSYHTIHNTGQIEENGIKMTNQCLWISIKDYLRYCRGQELSVTEIKKMGGLNANSDYEMFDWENRSYRHALETIIRVLNITINFFLVDNTGKHHKELYLNGRPIPMHVVGNKMANTDTVNIAFYGAHFEFIVEGNGIRPCFDINHHTIKDQIGDFKPNLIVTQPELKGDVKDDFVGVYEKINNNNIQIEFLMMRIEKNTNERDQLKRDGQRVVDNVEKLQYAGVSDSEKHHLLQQYSNQFNSIKKTRNDIDATNIDLQIQIDELIAENEELFSVYNALIYDSHPRKGAYDSHPREGAYDSRLREGPTGKSLILIYCHPKKVFYKDKSSHWWLESYDGELGQKSIMDYILDKNNIKPDSTIFKTVDIHNNPDYKMDGFSSEFISKHQNEFDMVLLPDCGGRWYDIINMKDETEQSILLYSLIESLAYIVKPGGKLYLSKLIFTAKVLDNVSFDLRKTFRVHRHSSDLLEIIKY